MRRSADGPARRDAVRLAPLSLDSDYDVRSSIAGAFLAETLDRTMERPAEPSDPALVERADRFLASMILGK